MMDLIFNFSTGIDTFNTMINLVVCISAFYCIILAVKKPSERVKYSQTAVVLGIFGTFAGITIGLINFDATNIDGSVPGLLSGLRTAFFTSLAGQIASIAITSTRFYTLFFTIFKGDKSQILTENENSPRELDISDIVLSLNSIKNSIVGDGDTTMLTQLQKMRTSTNDSLNELNSSFKQFSLHMVENTNKAIVEALRDVIKDFNVKLNEQFGDNFKQLNQAVKEMITWQDRYKSFVESSEKELKNSIEHMKDVNLTLKSTNEVLNQVAKNTEDLAKTSEKIANETRRAMDCVNEFGEVIGTLNSVASQSKDLFPILERNLNNSFEQSSRMIEEASRKIIEHGNLIDRQYAELRRQLESALNSTTKALEDQVVKLDRELGAELTKSLNSLGNQLATLSNKFVSDYTPLTERLKQVVEMSRRV